MIDLDKLRESKGYLLAIVNTKTGEYEPISEDVMPIRHGKWYELAIYDGCEVDLMCSNCGATVSGFVQDYKFCPYCGARMDEK